MRPNRWPQGARDDLRRLAAVTVVALTAFTSTGCEQEQPPPPPPPPSLGPDSVIAATPPAEGDLVFDREFLFLSSDADSLVVVPWFFRARATPAGVQREQTAWLFRAGDWEVLSQQSRTTPPTRKPWRILPGETIRLIVGPGDRIESLLLRDPPRELETVLDALMTEWTTVGSESIRMYRGHTQFPSGTVDGIVLEISRRWEASEDGGPGDWAFLYGGSDMQLFVEGERPQREPEESVPYRGWSRVALRDLQWPELSVVWEELRAYEDARRNVPIRWGLNSPAGEIVGSVEAISSHLLAGQGDGPLLPLLGLFGVSGSVRIEGEEFSVAGFLRHTQR